ncbi:DcrB-related protein [Pseudomonas sp. RC10]|uniref:DcrB-related protein n=1 Tax=Pseudomonas bambusae TaxID=3139142 RepID=UPI0031392B35
MTYRINEFQFALPDAELQDSSINILKFPALETSLIISRSFLADDETLHSNFDAQLKRLEQQVSGLRYQPPQAVRVGPAQEIEALELRSQFSKAADNVYQYQLALVLPGTRKMLALSYVKAQPLGDAEAEHWTRIKLSLTFDGIQ